jgi:hypothetical protein
MPPPDCIAIHHGQTVFLTVESERAMVRVAELGMAGAVDATHPLQDAARIVLTLLDAGLRVETHRSH